MMLGIYFIMENMLKISSKLGKKILIFCFSNNETDINCSLK